MAKFFEPLAGGVKNRAHPAMLREGELQKALDAEYRPDDPGIWVSPARARCGTLPVSEAPVTALIPLVWDPGTTVDGTTEELRQFAFVDPGEPRVLHSVPASTDPADTSWDSPRTYTLTDGGAASFGSRLDFAAFDNDYFLFPGTTENYCLRREETGQKFLRHGMPKNEVDLEVEFALGPLQGIWEVGFYAYWITWYDHVNDIEGDRPDPAFWDEDQPNVYPPTVGFKNFIRQTSTIAVGANVAALVKASKFVIDNRPPNATRIRIYRSRPFDPDLAPSQAFPLSNPWPLGWLIAEVDPTTLVLNTNPLYYNLFTDYFAVPSDLIDRFGKTTKDYDVISIGGVMRGANGPPPAASTGDVYENCLMTNDLADPRKVRWSVPGNPHAFPDLNVANLDSKESDEVRVVRTLGQRAFIGMAESVWKFNWLPVEGDADGASGRIKDIVAEGKGTLGPAATTRWTLPRLVYAPEGTLYGTMIAWVSRDGVYATDLDNVIKLTRGIRWPAVTDAVLLDNPEKERLEVGIYTGERIGAPGAPEGVPDAWIFIHYSDGHIRTTGPVRRPGGIYSAALMRQPTGSYVLSSDMDKRFAIEGVGSVEGATGEAPELDVTTREIYPNGFLEEQEIGRAFVHSDGPGTVQVHLDLDSNNSPKDHDKTPLRADPLSRWSVQKGCERVTFRVRASGQVRLNFIGAEDDGQTLGVVDQ